MDTRAGETRDRTFDRSRRRLWGIAYRMLGSRADADDMVQETWLRWHRAEVDRIGNAEAWLVASITRICIDRLRRARTEREAYVGPWLPEPLVGEAMASTDGAAELASDLSVAFLALLERLAPEERAAFLLHEVFDSGYGDIAQILGKSQAACRQIVSRARRRVSADRPRVQVSAAARAALVEALVRAIRARDEATLVRLVGEGATWTTDGGGKARAARKVVRGADRIVRLLLGLSRRYLPFVELRTVDVNGEPGLALLADGRVGAVWSIRTDGLRVLDVFVVMNPDKLRAVRLGDPP
jgi:RNA polymerase sigma-70 factor (ECF subfamily)